MNSSVSSLRDTITPKSDQLNADDLVGVAKTIKVTSVKRGSADQPISIHYEGDGGRPYKPCKSMRRVLIYAWGDNGAEWAGRSMQLYNDPLVKFGGVKVGGIRISHVSHIDSVMTMQLTASRGKRAPYKVSPLSVEPVANLGDVLDKIASATTKGQLSEAAIMAGALAGDAEKNQARSAYSEKLKEIEDKGDIMGAASASNNAAPPTYAEITDMVNNASSKEEAEAAAAMGQHLPVPQIAELDDMVIARFGE